MLEHVCIVNHGGMVLWSRSFGPALRRNPVDAVIREVLLEDRAGQVEHLCGDYKVRWALDNEHQFVVVAVTQRFLQLRCIDPFLQDLRDHFGAAFGSVAAGGVGRFAFDEAFDKAHCGFLAAERQAVPDAEEAPTAPTRRPLPKGTKKPKPEPKADPKDSWKNRKGGGAKSPESEEPPAAAEPTEEELRRMVERYRQQHIQRDTSGRPLQVQEHNWAGREGPRGRLSAWLRNYVGVGRELDESDLAKLLPPLKDKLIAKNVAVEVAETVCSSVSASLKGTRIGQFEQLNKAVEVAMVEALKRILRPKTDIDILRMAAAAKARQRPLSIVVCGVNGVGKSTSLAKIGYWLQQNGLSLLMAAGDTFRHGAVEQLQVHARCLDVPIFSLGYGTDPTEVAGQAMQAAARSGRDVVLIDTAGRMQNHESRMRALARTIHDNSPDLVLFVGEALVGNNGIDQLRRFNKCLVDYTPVGREPRGIDGIMLTKFDTIDDKVGSAVSMVYELGQPILFVGVGQTYQDLKTIEPDMVVEALMR